MRCRIRCTNAHNDEIVELISTFDWDTGDDATAAPKKSKMIKFTISPPLLSAVVTKSALSFVTGADVLTTDVLIC